eukprot:GEMP01017340.1.p1 GENE.GEMP01017340.1~~GEMP01017340.1.p1  ORF type:complete len:809 (+),score=136.37 GEMP01017340.1:156-2582(+)
MGVCCGSLSGGTRVVPDALSKEEQQNAIFVDIMAFIAKQPLFKTLSNSDRPRLANAFTTKTYTDGQNVVVCGEEGNELFLIKNGNAMVYITKGDSQKHQVATLVKGDYFGEGALLRGEPRNATVTSVGTLETLSITRKRFDGLGLRDCLRFAKRRAVGGQGAAADEEAIAEPTEPLSDEVALILEQGLRGNKRLCSVLTISEQQFLECVKKCVKLPLVTKGTDIIKQDDLSCDTLYIVQTGSFDVIQSGQQDKARSADVVAAVEEMTAGIVGKITSGQSFGELALLYNSPRNATVRAAEDSIVWALHRIHFKNILVSEVSAGIGKMADLLKKIELFLPLLQVERYLMAEAMINLHYKEGETIIAENEDGNSFFILIEGTVRIFKKGEVIQDLVANKSLGECPHFGERALLANEPRNATIKVVSETVKAVSLDRASFNLLLGPLEELLAKVDEKRQDGKVRRETSHSEDFKRRNMTKSRAADQVPLKKNLRFLGLLGCGGFGRVTLEKDMTNNKVYAMKSISKGYICALAMQKSILQEKSILLMTSSNFIIELFACYNDDTHVYFLLEACLGGELYATYHRKNLHGNHACAQFFSASTTQAIIHLHERRIIYRDLKPENILMTKEGYCKLADFGLAKFVIGRTYTTCGTPDYFAPEVLSGNGHNYGIDWWTLGILIFELMQGKPPFDSPDPLWTYQKIKIGIAGVRFRKPTFSPSLIDLIKNLLKTEASDRLPCRAGGHSALMGHSWYHNFSWDDLLSQKLEPPYVPEMKDKIGLSNFDARPDDMPPEVEYDRRFNTGWDKNFEKLDEF